MDFRLLGPLEVVGDGDLSVSIGAGRQRALLALLLLRPNELVQSDRLVELLWGDSPPATANKMLHNQVSSLRQALGRDGRLETQGSGYRLNVQPGERDVDRFEALFASGRARVDSDPDGASERLREALAIWRGPPLSDLAYEAFAQTEISRLAERRLVALEARIDADLALGRHADLVSELEAAVAEEPLRERLHGQLMLALYRCGRQAEALEAYRAARRTLVEEVGVEPGPELRTLQEEILSHDRSLDVQPPIPQELPSALDRGSPVLAGRAAELVELTELLETARAGRGEVVSLCGPDGIGKTRLAAEVAREALARRMAVLYCSADADPADALDVVRKARQSERPALIVVDDADDAGRDLLDDVAKLRDGSRLVLVLCGWAEGGRLIELEPLRPDAVAEIARLYLPGDETFEALSAEALTAESGGVPRAAHRLAAEWARARASRAAEQSAERAAAGRGALRAAEDDLSHDLIALHAVEEDGRRYATGADGAPLPVVCPFLGLATFDGAHAEYFFGRERLVAEMVARLVGSPLLAVVGPSGSGKSSAVRAGLLPALASGVVPGSERWSQALMRPGACPLAALERALPDGGEHALLVIDQFEEVFVACRDQRERLEFLDALAALVEEREDRVQIVIAIRADFYGQCAAHARIARLVGANQVLVGPMGRDELRRAIVEPARRVGLRVEPSLTDALIADVLDEPGGLPLLSAALLEQWRERDGHVLRRAAYEHTGGVRGAVGRLAEGTYTRLSAPQRVAAKRIFLRLADAEEVDAFVRRRVPLDELPPDAGTAGALGHLVDSRLLTAAEGTVEVAHEALLREWPRLRGWLEEDAEGRRLHQHLAHAAQDWQQEGRDPGELYRGARLASALDWDAGHRDELNPLEREFLNASKAEAEHEADHQRRTNRRLRGLLAGLAALLGLAIVAGVVALNQRGDARDAARKADAQRLSVEAVNEERLDKALLLARAAVDLDESATTRGNLLSILLRTPSVGGVINQGWPMYGAAISPDGKLMATGDEQGAVYFYDATTRRALGPPYSIESGLIQNVRFSPDGRTLAISFLDRSDPSHAALELLDANSRKLLLSVRLPALDQPVEWIYTDVLFPPDGDTLLVHPVPGSAPDGPAAPVYRIDRRTGEIVERIQVGRSASYFYASTTTRGDRFFLTSQRDNRTWELDADGLRMLRSWPVGDVGGAVSPDGRSFALASPDGSIRLLDLDTGGIRRFRRGHDGRVLRLEFTPDGRTLVTAGQDGTLLAWNVDRGAIAQRLNGHTDAIDGLALTADGRTLVTASVDTRAIVWDLAGDRRLDRSFPVGAPFAEPFTPRGIAVSPDGRTLAVTQSDGKVDLIDTRRLRRRASVQALDGHAASVDFSPDGRLLAVTGVGGRLTLWNARSLAPAGELKGMRADSQALAFSPDGKQLAAAEALVSADAPAGGQQPMRVWDVRRRTLTRFRGNTSANLIAFSPDGKLIAGGATQVGTDIRDARTGELVKRLGVGNLASEGDFSRSVAFSPDGDLLFVDQYGGTGRLFSTDTWKPVGRPLEAHTARITFPEFTPDGRRLVTAAADGTVVLWDVKTQKPIGSPLRLAPDSFASVALSPDGSRLYAVSTRGPGISFNLSPEAWKRHACAVAGRELTPEEWQDALPDRPYRALCSS